MKVYKYALGYNDETILVHPIHRIVDVKMQFGTVVMWAEVDETKPQESFDYVVVGTGESPNYRYPRHFGTLLSGNMVYHYYTDYRPKADVQELKAPKMKEIPLTKKRRSVPAKDVPQNGIVFYYIKADGSERLVRLTVHSTFVKNGEQYVHGYDHDVAKDKANTGEPLRTFVCSKISEWPEIIE